MSHLIVVGFKDEFKADEVLINLMKTGTRVFNRTDRVSS